MLIVYDRDPDAARCGGRPQSARGDVAAYESTRAKVGPGGPQGLGPLLLAVPHPEHDDSVADDQVPDNVAPDESVPDLLGRQLVGRGGHASTELREPDQAIDPPNQPACDALGC